MLPYTVYNIMLLILLISHLSFMSDMLLSFLLDNNFLLDIVSVNMLPLMLYNIMSLPLYMRSFMLHYMFMLHSHLMLHISYYLVLPLFHLFHSIHNLYSHMLIMLYYIFMLHMHYMSSYSYYMLSLVLLNFMLHSSDMLLLIMYYMFMFHMPVMLSHSMLYSHSMLSFIILLHLHSLHSLLYSILLSSNLPS